MANWYGTSRSNYVHISDEEGLKKTLEIFKLNTFKDSKGRTAFSASDDSNGDWPSWGWISKPDPEDPDIEIHDEIAFDFVVHVMPYVAEGEVLVIMSAGAEKLRYITGHAAAFIRQGAKVKAIHLSLEDIYKQAARKFKTVLPISNCAY